MTRRCGCTGLPRPLGERRLVAGEPALGRADQVAHLRVGGAQFGEDFLGGDAAVHDPDPLGRAVAAADRREHPAQGRLVGGVAREHLVGERQALRSDHEGDDDLHAVAAFVAAVAETAGIVFVGRHVALEVGARQIVEQHLVARAEQIAPALAQVAEEFLLQRQEQIVAAVERVILHGARVHPEEIGEGGRAEPNPVQPPLAAGREQPVNHEDAQHFFPIGVLAADRQARAEEVIQMQRAPEMVAEPARAPLAGMLEAQRVEAHLHRVGAAGRRRAVGGEQRELAQRARMLVKDGDGAFPRELLAVIDLTEVEHVALRDLAARVATALHDRPRAVLLAVLPPHTALQEHAGSLADRGPAR